MWNKAVVHYTQLLLLLATINMIGKALNFKSSRCLEDFKFSWKDIITSNWISIYKYCTNALHGQIKGIFFDLQLM